jgi:CheY-like chemotaxis protein
MPLTTRSNDRGCMPGDKPLHKHILLVDDEGTVRETLRFLLLSDRHIVVEANNGAEALALFTRGRFDLVILDYQMPFMKGDELASHIRKVAPHQRILMITAYALKPSPENPVDAILNKPFELTRLRQVMAQLLAAPGEALPACAPSETREDLTALAS